MDSKLFPDWLLIKEKLKPEPLVPPVESDKIEPVNKQKKTKISSYISESEESEEEIVVKKKKKAPVKKKKVKKVETSESDSNDSNDSENNDEEESDYEDRKNQCKNLKRFFKSKSK